MQSIKVLRDSSTLAEMKEVPPRGGNQKKEKRDGTVIGKDRTEKKTVTLATKE